MPFSFAHRFFRHRLAAFIPLIAVASGFTSWAAPVDKTLIESAILIHHEELTDPGPLYASSRFRRAQISAANVTQAIDDANSSGNLPSGLTATIKSLFKGAGQNTNVEIKDGFQAALEYIKDQKETFGLDVEQIGKAGGRAKENFVRTARLCAGFGMELRR